MKYAIISDIHGNLEALEAVISTFPGEAKILCLGDTVGYGADPVACIERVTSLGAVNILGNHDSAVIGSFDMDNLNVAAGTAALWTREQMGDKDKEYLKSLELLWKDETVSLVHGSMHSPEEFFYMFSIEEARLTFELMTTKLCFVGHSHVPCVFVKKGDEITMQKIKEGKIALESGASYIVNAGSVGQPRDTDPRACYCVYDTDDNSLEFHRVTYDVAAASAKIMNAGLPAALGERLLYGM